jgi:hypothetical protein
VTSSSYDLNNRTEIPITANLLKIMNAISACAILFVCILGTKCISELIMR